MSIWTTDEEGGPLWELEGLLLMHRDVEDVKAIIERLLDTREMLAHLLGGSWKESRVYDLIREMELDAGYLGEKVDAALAEAELAVTVGTMPDYPPEAVE